jgi:hypothetical protein
MAYIDGKLASGERVLRREHQHWFVLVADARYGILVIVAAILLLILRAAARTSGDVDRIIGYVVLALVLGGLAYLGWQILRWVNEEFAVTTRRVLQLEGVLNKQVTDSSLEKINDAILTQSLFGRIFGFGDLDILTASESGISRLRMLKDADHFKRAMLEAKHELELELSGARPLPSPPLRASSGPTSGPAPAPSAAPSSEMPQRTEMTADELTRTLASLADLRDRGAISAEEYEAKKADILRRL